MTGSTHMGTSAVNITSINLAGTSQKKVQTTDDILKQIEASMPDASELNKYKQEELSARVLGRIGQHEAAFGDQHLPRSRLPKVDAVLLDRYQAARRNVLLLGAIKAASTPGPSTHRSAKGSAAAKGTAAHTDSNSTDGTELDRQSDYGAGGGLDSRFTSFTDAGESLGAQCSQLSMSSRAGSARRMRRQASNHSAGSSCAGSTTSGATAVSRHMTRQASSLSAGSGRTMRSDITGVSRPGTFRTHRRTPRKKAQKPKPGRVTVAMAEYGQKDDWMSKTLLRHYLASVIQARWRGYHLRKRWAQPESRTEVVAEVKAKHSAEELRQHRLRDLQHRLVTFQQKQLAKAAAAAAEAAAAAVAGAEAAEEAGGSGPAAGGGSSGFSLPPIGRAAPGGLKGAAFSRSRVASGGLRRRSLSSRGNSASGSAQKLKYLQSVRLAGQIDAYQLDLDESSSDSGWSDIELEDVASIKFRAVTPPWQRTTEQSGMSKQLRQRTAAAAAAATGKTWPPLHLAGSDCSTSGGIDELLGAIWSEDNRECNARLQELRHRRICRRPDPVVLSEPAAAAAAASGLLGSTAECESDNSMAAGLPDGVDDSDSPLPSQVVEQILLERYSTKYNRLGVPERMPGREKWLKQQHAAKEAAKAAEVVAAASAAAAKTNRLLSRTGGTTLASGTAGDSAANASSDSRTVTAR